MAQTPYLSEDFFVSFKEMLFQVAQGIAEAQKALDEQALELQRRIFTDPELKELRDSGVQATWYQIPETTATLKVGISVHSESSGEGKSARRLLLSPYSATFKNSFSFDYSGTSEVTFKIVPTPPPIATSFTVVPNVVGKTKKEAEEVIAGSKLIVGEASEEASEAPQGTVIAQTPEAGVLTRMGNLVNIVISKG